MPLFPSYLLSKPFATVAQSKLSRLHPLSRQPSCEDNHAAYIVPLKSRMPAEFFPLLNLPPELILCVFDVLAKESDWTTLTCFGLSCNLLYHTLKERYHPTPIALANNLWYSTGMDGNVRAASCYPGMKNNGDYVPLTYMIKDFIGPNYRLLGGELPPIFVSTKLYGEHDDWLNKFERDLRGRRRDFRMMTFYRDGESKFLLPNPYNKGEGWIEEVWEIWLQFENMGWTKDMEEHFRRNFTKCNVFKTLVQRMQLIRPGNGATNGARKKIYSSTL